MNNEPILTIVLSQTSFLSYEERPTAVMSDDLKAAFLLIYFTVKSQKSANTNGKGYPSGPID
jgi:hypothetical protein